MKKFLLLAALMLARPAAAAPMVLPLTPGNMLAQTHSHAIITTIIGTYRQLSGTLNYDSAAGTCAMDVTFEVKSLQLPNALIRAQTMSQGFLDPDEFPQTHFIGACQGGTLAGNLTLRGQTHPFTMHVSYQTVNGQPTAIHLEGSLNRYDWGLNGLSLTVGKIIRITNDISLNGQPPVAR